MPYLNSVTYKLPNKDLKFITSFLKYLSPVGDVVRDEITLRKSNRSFLPTTSILFTNTDTPQVCFELSDNTSVSIDITNTTNVSKKSLYKYSHISLEDFINRVSPYKLVTVDHTGFNLPYFGSIHPQIIELRKKLKNICLYHTFPKHLEDATWDFILPGTTDEINKEVKTDYSLRRTPKIEIVSFENSSTPLIQLEFLLEGKYEDWVKVFPEAIAVDEVKSLWIYIKNSSGIDTCFVLNETQEKDWGYHFEKDRLF